VTDGSGRDKAWPASALWDYAVALYASPGVAAACLALQDRRGTDVNLLLFACWLGATGQEPNAGQLAEVLERAEVWQADLVRPLREARRRLEAVLPTLEESLRPPLAAARADLAAVELALERGELLLLEGFTRDAAVDPARRGRILANQILRHIAAINRDDDSAFRALLAAAFPESGWADATPADPASSNHT